MAEIKSTVSQIGTCDEPKPKKQVPKSSPYKVEGQQTYSFTLRHFLIMGKSFSRKIVFHGKCFSKENLFSCHVFRCSLQDKSFFTEKKEKCQLNCLNGEKYQLLVVVEINVHQMKEF